MAARTVDSMSSSPELSPSHGRVAPGEVLSEESFHRMISLERRRSERSQRPFVLLLIETGHGDNQGRVLLDVLFALQGATRETDVTGWYRANSVVGVMFTEIDLDNNAVLSTILSRIGAILRDQLDTDQFSRIKFSFHVFPDDWDSQDSDRPSNPILYPDLEKRQESNRLGRAVKAADRRSGEPVVAGDLVASVFDRCSGDQADFPRAGPVSPETHRRARNPIHVSEIPVDVHG